jgi:YVTN family beta-propeller protein
MAHGETGVSPPFGAYNRRVTKAPHGVPHPFRTLVFAATLTVLLLLALASPAIGRYAYVSDGAQSVSVIDTKNNFVSPPITVGTDPIGIAITPDGKFAYVANFAYEEPGTVSVIDTQTNQVVGTPITVGKGPYGVAITPDGKFAYIPNSESGTVSVIDTQTNQVVGTPIMVGGVPRSIAITPDGEFAYVARVGASSVSVIDTQTNQVVGTPITVGAGAEGVAITPDGKFAYVTVGGEALSQPGTVSVIDTQTNQVVGTPIMVGKAPWGVAITPDGRYAYVTNANSYSVSIVDTQTHLVSGPIPLGNLVEPIAITPDGKRAYVGGFSANLFVIDTQTNQTGAPIPLGSGQNGIAIVPDQPPVASFTDPAARPGVPITFNAAASSDPDGSIASYDWSFGDGQTAPNGGLAPSHTYSRPGSYQVELTLTDNEGCSTALIFTGQTAYCNGSALASQTQTVKVAYPGVRVNCPRSAKPKGCKLKLQVVSKRRKGKAESAVAKAHAKAGRSVIVSLKPKKKFRAKLAVAKKLLVKETVTINGSKRVSFPKLKVAQ